MGFAIGGLLGGVLRDATGSFGKTVGIIAALAFAAGCLVAALYREKLPPVMIQRPDDSTVKQQHDGREAASKVTCLAK